MPRRKYIISSFLFPKYNQQDATLRNLFTSVKYTTCFRPYLRLSSGAQNRIYSIGYLSNLYCWLPLSWKRWKIGKVLDAVYTVLSSWWWAEVPPETCRAFHIRSPKAVYTASGTCQTFTAACRCRGRVGRLEKYPMLYIQFWAPDDGRRYRLKRVEHFTEINKLCNVAFCWLYLEIYLRCTDPWTSNDVMVFSGGNKRQAPGRSLFFQMEF
jgi:hypothetical protein